MVFVESRSVVDDALTVLEQGGRLSPNTLSAYRTDLKQFDGYLRVEEATPKQVADFLAWLKDEQGFSPATLARKLAAIKWLFAHLLSTGVVATNPAADLVLPGVKKPLPRAISTQDVEQLLAKSRENTSPEGLRDRAMLELLCATGMRISEAVQLNLADLNFDQRTVRCTGRGNRVRVLPLDAIALDALDEYLRRGRPYLARLHASNAVFLNWRSQRLTRQGFWLVMKPIVRKSGLENVSPHTLRHSFAAHSLQAGMSVSKLREQLGHANISTTQVYARVKPEPVAERRN